MKQLKTITIVHRKCHKILYYLFVLARIVENNHLNFKSIKANYGVNYLHSGAKIYLHIFSRDDLIQFNCSLAKVLL